MNTAEGEEILIDLTDDDVTPATLAEGVTAHAANGERITGTMATTSVLYTEQVLTTNQQAQARENIGITDIQKQTSLPASGTTLTANTEYRVSSTVGTYQFNFPSSGDVYVRFTTAGTYAISFKSGTKFLGAAPEFAARTTYELMARDGVVAVGEVVTA